MQRLVLLSGDKTVQRIDECHGGGHHHICVCRMA